jgi:NAD(P)-dependent dehydrogenase (short-subunit alcohol dehydrogenase family)
VNESQAIMEGNGAATRGAQQALPRDKDRWVRSLEGAVTLVTGSGRGLGEAICHSLSEAGAIVLAADIRPQLADNVAQQLRSEGRQATAMELDVGDERQVADAVGRIVADWGRLDVVVNNAAVDYTLPVEELTVEQWDCVVRTNLRGPFLLSRQAFPIMKRQGSGHIVNIASTASKRNWPNASAYHATKWGLLGLSHALHAEGRPHRIKVTAIIAGGMRTPFLLDRFPDINPEVLQDPRNVANAVRFALMQPDETVIPEVMVLPMRETSWP